MENHELTNGVYCLSLPDPRFKTALMTVALMVPLKKETVEEYALLPRLLTRNCAAFPDLTAFNRHLDRLYGASVSGRSVRIGEVQMLLLMITGIADRYTPNGSEVTAACADLLCRMLFEPVLSNGSFAEDAVLTERRCLAQEARSIINNKQLYAQRRAEELLCPKEPYSIGALGDPAVIETLTPKRVTDAWKRLLRTARVQIILQSEDTMEKAKEAFQNGFAAFGDRTPVNIATDTVTCLPALREKTEKMAVNQSKLVMGFRTHCAAPDPAVPAMRLFCALLGGTATSLLFRNVREKQSLCYYCSSSYDRYKGVLFVKSGVDAAQAERAKAEILKQIDAVKRGDFSDEDLRQAKLAVVESFTATGDSQSGMFGFYMAQSVIGTFKTPEETKAQIEAVTKNDVIAAANRLSYECVYLLEQEETANG